MIKSTSRGRIKAQVSISDKPAVPRAAALKVLIASHSHPQLSKGGAEIAAHQLFNTLNESAGFEAWFLGCNRETVHHRTGATFSQPFSPREFMYAGGAFDWFKFANRDPKFPAAFRELLRHVQPDVVHFHHYLNFGVEAFLHVREALPKCRIVVTLHEYLALCHHYGQMVTKQNRTLCYEATPTRCAGCFEEFSTSDFFLRKAYIRRFFDLVDRFIAPSRFLAERYAAWGIPRERLRVTENVTPASTTAAEPTATLAGLLRVGYFGQISVLKGINVLFDAADYLLEKKVDDVVFDIYGDHRGQPPEFRSDFLERLGKAGRNVKFHGPYDQATLDHLMQRVDVVLVPSIWWENSPVVIQEALRNRRPVICSDIGGMAEKVRDGVDGFHFPVGSSMALARLLMGLTESPSKLTDLGVSLRAPPSVQDLCEPYRVLYASLVGEHA